MEFYFDFLGIFPDLISFKKDQKGSRRGDVTCRGDVAHDRHVAGPREPTWTPAWRLNGMNSN